MRRLLLFMLLAAPTSAQTLDSNGWVTPYFAGASNMTSWNTLLARYRAGVSAAPVSFDGVTITATTSGASATITVSGYTPQANEQYATLTINGGTNFIPGRYPILSVSGQTYTLGRVCSTGSGSAMTGWVRNAQPSIAAFGDSNYARTVSVIQTVLRTSPLTQGGEGYQDAGISSITCAGPSACGPASGPYGGTGAQLSTPVYTGTWTGNGAGSRSVDAAGISSSDTTTSACGGTGGCASITGTFTEASIHYPIFSGGGTFQWRIDGGSWSSPISQNGTASGGVVLIPQNTGTPLSNSSHTIDFQVVSGTVGLAGWRFTKTNAGIIFNMAAHSGGRVDALSPTPVSGAPVAAAAWIAWMQDIAADVIIFTFANNEARQGVSPSQQATYFRTMLSEAQSANPNVTFLMLPPQEDHDTPPYNDNCTVPYTSSSCTLNYVNAQWVFYNANSQAFLSIHPFIGHYEPAVAAGYMQDCCHLSVSGATVVSNLVVPFLLGESPSIALGGKVATGSGVTLH